MNGGRWVDPVLTRIGQTTSDAIVLSVGRLQALWHPGASSAATRTIQCCSELTAGGARGSADPESQPWTKCDLRFPHEFLPLGRVQEGRPLPLVMEAPVSGFMDSVLTLSGSFATGPG